MSPKGEDTGMSHKEFFEKALTVAGEWTRFADPKALGVAVFLSFGANDLIRSTRQLFFGFSADGTWLQWVISAAFLGACASAIIAVGFISAALFPRLKPKGPNSLFYFGSIAQVSDPETYEQEVRKLGAQELESQIAHQAWNVATTAATKHKWTQRAYFGLLLFVALWVFGRVASSFL